MRFASPRFQRLQSLTLQFLRIEGLTKLQISAAVGSLTTRASPRVLAFRDCESLTLQFLRIADLTKHRTPRIFRNSWVQENFFERKFSAQRIALLSNSLVPSRTNEDKKVLDVVNQSTR